LASGARDGETSVRPPFSTSSSSWALMASGSAPTPSSTRRTTLSWSAAYRRCSLIRSRLPHSTACWAARCKSSVVASEKYCVMSICSVCLLGAIPPPPRVVPKGSSSKNLPKKSSNRLPRPSLPPPRGESSKAEPPRTPASAAWISQRCSTLSPSPGIIRLTVTTAGLMPQT
jgi:hypothetical protein